MTLLHSNILQFGGTWIGVKNKSHNFATNNKHNNFKWRKENDYSSFHIVQITDFLEFFHEYCKEKSDTCTKF